MNKRKLIVLEGLDGSGKSTQVKLLSTFLKEKNISSIIIQNPSESEIGQLIRKVLQKKLKYSNACLQMLFTADKINILDELLFQKVTNEDIIILDRYVESFLAYGGIDCNKEWLYNVIKVLAIPDLTIYLDVSPEICINRLKNKKKEEELELFEHIDLLRKVKKNYDEAIEQLSTTKKIVKVNGEMNINDVSNKIQSYVIPLIYETSI